MSDERYKLIVAAARRHGASFPTTEAWLDFKAAIDQTFPLAQLEVQPVIVAPAPAPIYTGPVGMIDATLMKIACPENTLEKLAEWAPATQQACKRWGIDTVREVASFLANIGVESAGLTRLEENMNYSAKRMAQVWPGRFGKNPALAAKLAHNPEALANHVYANRMGNGPPESGDGWRHRGFGPKQLTGKDNHRRFSEAAGIPLDQVPAFLRTKEGGMMSAGWFWFDNGMDAYAATAGIEDDRKKINGGLIGVDDVRKRFDALVKEIIRREKLAC